VKIETGTQELLCDLNDRVAVVTLNKPDKKNALGDILTPALRDILLTLDHHEGVGCVMITGSGNAFCSGGDISGMGGGTAAAKSEKDRIADLTMRQETLTKRLFELSKPTIAALPGAAAGAGLSIALACDIRVSCESAFITTAFANIGLSGDYGASWFLPRIVGLSRAKHLFFTAERLGALQCRDIGLIDRVFPDASFRSEAFEYARVIANGATMAIGLMKTNLNNGLSQSLSASLAMEAEHLIRCAGGIESREAIKAFMEKRKPIFHDNNHR
jgi:enoyl-CoA hydratase/carnithine racemase